MAEHATWIDLVLAVKESWTKGDLDALRVAATRKDYERGLTLEEVAYKTGYSTDTIARCLWQSGGARSANSCPREERRTKEIVELRVSGLSYQQIANKFGVTRERVRQILKRVRPDLCYRQRGVTTKCKMCGTEFQRIPSQGQVCCSADCAYQLKGEQSIKANWPQTERAIGLRLEGKGWKEIAAELGVSKATAYRRIGRAGQFGLVDQETMNKCFPRGGSSEIDYFHRKLPVDTT